MSGPNDPVQETVFISTKALNTLLHKATSIFCVFLSPDNSFTERRIVNKQMQGHPPTEYATSIKFSDDFQTLYFGKHLYWQNRLCCKLNGCIPLDTKAVET